MKELMFFGKMAKYLDPKADLTFKKVFGQHKDLVISLINALLPLTEEQEVQSVEYLPPELVPDTPTKKDSIVDVRCKDARGRQFIVEMQMIWTPAFQQRVLFNASKAFVRQLDKAYRYESLQPVYSLNLVNETFMPDLPECIHNYHIVHELHTDRIIEGLHLTFVELPKFTPHTMLEKRMAVLWLEFLTSIDEETRTAPESLLSNPHTSKALEEVEISAFSDAQLYAYDRFWDSVITERTLFSDSSRIAREKGMKEGMKEGLEQGLKQGLEQGMEQGLKQGHKEGYHQGLSAVAKRLQGMGRTAEEIANATGLDTEEVKKIIN